MDPRQTRVVATVETGALEPGWYSVNTKVQVGGRGGAAEIQGALRVRTDD